MIGDMNEAAPPSGAQRLVFDGPLTIYDAASVKGRLQAALDHEDASALELELSQVTEIDTAGLQLLMLARLESQRLKRPLRIVTPNAAVKDAIAFCRLEAFFGDALSPLAVHVGTDRD